MIPQIKHSLLDKTFEAMINRVRYQLDAKPRLEMDPSFIHASDCSGFVRYLLYHATAGALIIPDGSFWQRLWCERQQLHKVKYEDLHYARGDRTRLFICFIQPNHHESIGHVYLVYHGYTIECHAGAGVDQRKYTVPVLEQNTSECFELPFLYDL